MSFYAAGALVASYAIKNYQNNKLAEEQNAAFGRQLTHQGNYQGQIDDLISQLLTAQSGSSPADEKSAIEGEFRKVLADNHAGATGGFNLPVASDAYRAAAAKAMGDVHDYGKRIADLMGAADAYAQQRRNEGYAAQRYLDQINKVRALANGQGFVDQVDQNSIHADPYLSAAADVLGAFGTSYMPGLNAAGKRPPTTGANGLVPQRGFIGP